MRHVGFHDPHGCRAGWMDRLIVGDALSGPNGPARCTDETRSRRLGTLLASLGRPRPDRDPI